MRPAAAIADDRLKRARRVELDGRAECVANRQAQNSPALLVFREHSHRHTPCAVVFNRRPTSPKSAASATAMV